MHVGGTVSGGDFPLWLISRGLTQLQFGAPLPSFQMAALLGGVDVSGIAEMKGADVCGTCHLPVDAVTQALTLTDVSLCTSPPCVTVMGGPRYSVHCLAP